MASNSRSTGGRYPSVANDIIVGLPYVKLAQDTLREAGSEVDGPAERSNLLGLARLTLRNPDAAATGILARVAESPTVQDRLKGYVQPAEPLDQVLWGLRGLIADQYAGWTPPLAKNRIVGRVQGVGEISVGGSGEPTPLSAAPSLPLRASAPGRGVRVGVLDTGLYPQEWLSGGWVAPFFDTLQTSDPAFTEGHATFVTGLVLMRAPGVTVEVRQILEPDGTADSWKVAEAIVSFGRSGIDVLNLSFLCYTEDGQPPLVLSSAIDRLDPDIVVVAAAGNHGDEKDANGKVRSNDERRKAAWPAALDDVIAVGACNKDGSRASFSPAAPWVDVHAPGVGLVSTYLDTAVIHEGQPAVTFGGFAEWSGTSFAAAVVSGAIAARVDPGRVTAQAALQDILRSLTSGPASQKAGRVSSFLDVPTL